MLQTIVVKGPTGPDPNPNPNPNPNPTTGTAAGGSDTNLADAVRRAAQESAESPVQGGDDVPQGRVRLRLEQAGDVSARVQAEIEKDATFTRIDLPSDFAFYPWKTFAVRPLKGVHQAKIASAARQQSTRLLVECINTLLPSGVSAFDLTVPDFHWLLYWVRQHQYTRVPLQVRAICKNVDHINKVESGELDGKTLVNIADINNAIIEESGLDLEAVFENLSALEGIENVPLRGGTIGDVCELLDSITAIRERGGAANDVEADLFGEIGSLASMYDLRDANGKLEPLRKRIEAVKNMPAEDYLVLEKAAHYLSLYGLKETARVTCKECGAEIREAIRISAQSFLSDRASLTG